MPPDPAVYLIADADDDRQHEELEPHSRKRVGNMDKGAGDDAYDDDHEQKACTLSLIHI